MRTIDTARDHSALKKLYAGSEPVPAEVVGARNDISLYLKRSPTKLPDASTGLKGLRTYPTPDCPLQNGR